MILFLICPRNITLGQAVAMWNLLDIEFPVFDYISIFVGDYLKKNIN
jgi:hypothetical protein